MATKTHEQSNLSKSNKELATKRREQTKLELSIIHPSWPKTPRETERDKSFANYIETEQVVTFDVAQAGSMQLDLDLKNKRGAAGLSSLLAARTADNLSTRTERERERKRGSSCWVRETHCLAVLLVACCCCWVAWLLGAVAVLD